MRKNLLVALMSIVSVTLFAQTKPLFATFTTSAAQNNNFYFTLVSSVPSNTAEIEWGTGGKLTTTPELSTDLTWGTDVPSAFTTEGGEVTIKVYGENIVGITCSNKSLTQMTFSKPEIIKSLAVGSNQLKNYDFSKLTALEVLEINENGATALDFSFNTALRVLTISNNTLTSLNISKNAELTKLDASNCGITTIDFSAQTLLDNVLLSNNPLVDAQNVVSTLAADCRTITMANVGATALDFSLLTKLESVNLANNNLNSLNLGSSIALKIIHLSATATGVSHNLTTLDLSAYPNLGTVYLQGTAAVRQKLTSLTLTSAGTAEKTVAINAAYNDLEEIDVTGIPNLKTLNLVGNKFKMSALPTKQSATMTSYTYQPQLPMALATTLATGATLDLSAENNLFGVTALDVPKVPQPTTYVWKKADGTVLTAGNDYTEEETGKFTFARELIGASVYCEMKTAAFPNFKDANIYKTSEIQIVDPANIEQGELTKVRLIAVDGGLNIINLENNTPVSVFTVDGRLIQSFTASGSKTVKLQQGVYLVRVNNELIKAAVK